MNNGIFGREEVSIAMTGMVELLKVIQIGREFISRYEKEELRKPSKVHFKGGMKDGGQKLYSARGR